MSNNENYFLTQEQRDKLKQELKHLKNIEIPENAEEIEKARELGDLSENAEYHAAKERHAELYNRMEKIEKILSRATMIKNSQSFDKVELNHSVTIEWLTGIWKGQEETIKLLGFGDGKTEIEMKSPLGKHLLGAKVDDIVSYDAPAGRMKVKVLRIH